uniref:Uncharacterized protein n=1 Tax=Cavia porcellus TaxID=10141 RepID=A0A286XBY5_CAVPO
MAAVPLILLWATLLPSGLALPLPQEATGTREVQWEQAQDYLTRFYHLDSKTKDANRFTDKLKEMEKFFHLPITGKLNSRIIEIMQKPRCGVPDVAEYSLFANKPKWSSKVVTYKIVSYTSDLPHSKVDEIVAKALNLWSKEIPLNFRRIQFGTADIEIRFARGGKDDS